MGNIALFGTSADPPTLGHYGILQWLSLNFEQVAVWTSDNPFKSHFCPLENRIQMLNLMIQELEKNGFFNVNYYSELSHLRSLITVQYAQEIFPENSSFFLVIGGDLITQITHWYKCQELLSQVQLLIIPRAGFSINKQELNNLENLGAKYTIADFIPPEISSSLYRETQDINLLTCKVQSYINDHNLYKIKI